MYSIEKNTNADLNPYLQDFSFYDNMNLGKRILIEQINASQISFLSLIQTYLELLAKNHQFRVRFLADTFDFRGKC